MKVEIWRVLFITWPQHRIVTWLCRRGSLILSYQPVRLGVHRPCEIGDTTFFICHVTTISKYHVTLWVWFPHYHPPRFGAHRLCGSGNNGVCSISSNSNSNSNCSSNAEVPMPRFTNGRLLLTMPKKYCMWMNKNFTGNHSWIKSKHFYLFLILMLKKSGVFNVKLIFFMNINTFLWI